MCKKKQRLRKNAFRFFNNRISVRRSFFIREDLLTKLGAQREKKSDVLYMALKDFLRKTDIKKLSNIDFLHHFVDYKTEKKANLWVEYGQDCRVKNLMARGLSRQTILNYALEQYFKRN
jgi:hypothetical protein